MNRRRRRSFSDEEEDDNFRNRRHRATRRRRLSSTSPSPNRQVIGPIASQTSVVADDEVPPDADVLEVARNDAEAIAITHPPSLIHLQALTDFTSQAFHFLHPDYSCWVAVRDTNRLRFFPSVSIALLSIELDIPADVSGEVWSVSDISAEEVVQKQRHFILSEVKQKRRIQVSKEAEGIQLKKTLQWDIEGPRLLEALMRDKFRRHKDLRKRLLETGTRSLIFTKQAVDVNSSTIEFLNPDSIYGKEQFGGDNLVGRTITKIRQDCLHGRDIFRWVAQVLPLERALAKRQRLKIVERKGTEVLVQHSISDMIDKRQYFSNVKVDLMCLFNRFPENEKEDEGKIINDRRPFGPPVTTSFFVTMGKDSSFNEIICSNPTVSSIHACIVPLKNSKVALVDLGSTLGTFLNGTRIPEHVPILLKSANDEIKLAFSSRIYTVTYQAVSEHSSFRQKEQELEQRLKEIENSLGTKRKSEQPDLIVTVRNLAYSTTIQDLEDALAAFGLKAERCEFPRTRTYRDQQQVLPNAAGSGGVARLIFNNRTDAWKARDRLNHREVKGRHVIASST